MQAPLTLAISSAAILGSWLSVPAFAQGCDLSGSPRTTLRTPLMYGAPNSAPYQSAPIGQPPAVGDGNTPAPVHPGMGGPTTLLPYIPLTPANNIQYPSYQVPFTPTTQAPAGTLGPSMWAPPPSSTPGSDPGIVHSPINFYPPPVSVVSINPGGGISGSAPTQRWGGQTSQDFGRYKHHGTRTSDFGQFVGGQTSQDGPWQTRAGAQATQDLYGRRQPGSNGYPSTQTLAPY